MIELDNVSYGYGRTALFSGLSLKLVPGSFHFLTGPSGAGKTTLLRLCYADLRANSGKVRLFGQDAGNLTRDEVAIVRRRIGVVHQDCQFLDHLSIAENIALPLTVADRIADAQNNLAELLAWVSLGPQAGQRPPELSGGERRFSRCQEWPAASVSACHSCSRPPPGPSTTTRSKPPCSRQQSSSGSAIRTIPLAPSLAGMNSSGLQSSQPGTVSGW